jgi:hypothetical protein
MVEEMVCPVLKRRRATLTAIDPRQDCTESDLTEQEIPQEYEEVNVMYELAPLL